MIKYKITTYSCVFDYVNKSKQTIEENGAGIDDIINNDRRFQHQ